jgi:hypothetical protein
LGRTSGAMLLPNVQTEIVRIYLSEMVPAILRTVA